MLRWNVFREDSRHLRFLKTLDNFLGDWSRNAHFLEAPGDDPVFAGYGNLVASFNHDDQ